MKIYPRTVAALLMLSFCAAPVKAGILDLRVGAGLSAANPTGFEDRVKAVSGTELKSDSFDTYNADVVFHLPVVPMTVGVRYEQASQSKSSGGDEWKLNVNNLALLASFRLINSKFYLGPIVSAGYPWANLKFKNNGSSQSTNFNNQQISYSGGLETGVYLGPFLVGAEAGYKSVHLKSSSSGSGSTTTVNSNIKLDGFYGKAMIGLTFL